MKRIEFFNREREKEEIMNILKSEPRLINFIYGPINSGKTTLITNLIENLPNNYFVIYVNLRERVISSYKDFLEAIFDVKNEGMLSKITRFLRKDYVNDVISDVGKVYGIPILRGIFSRIFTDEKPKDAFIYILNLIRNIKSKGKTPVFIIDELQKIGDVKVDNYLIYDVFNFFIRLTKELHICHVFTLSSDSLFIEKVYNEAMLEGRANYLLVDDFDEKTTKKFLKKHKIKDDEINYIVKYVGGKPIDLVEIIYLEDRKKWVEQRISLRNGQIEKMLKKVRELGEEVVIDDEKHDVSYKNLLKTLSMFERKEEIKLIEINEISEKFFVEKNVLFVDSMREIVKPQSRINLIALRKVFMTHASELPESLLRY